MAEGTAEHGLPWPRALVGGAFVGAVSFASFTLVPFFGAVPRPWLAGACAAAGVAWALEMRRAFRPTRRPFPAPDRRAFLAAVEASVARRAASMWWRSRAPRLERTADGAVVRWSAPGATRDASPVVVTFEGDLAWLAGPRAVVNAFAPRG